MAEVLLKLPETALTLHWKNGKVTPYAETREQLGGIQILEAQIDGSCQTEQAIPTVPGNFQTLLDRAGLWGL